MDKTTEEPKEKWRLARNKQSTVGMLLVLSAVLAGSLGRLYLRRLYRQEIAVTPSLSKLRDILKAIDILNYYGIFSLIIGVSLIIWNVEYWKSKQGSIDEIYPN